MFDRASGRRIAAVLLSAALALSLTACSGTGSGNQPAASYGPAVSSVAPSSSSSRQESPEAEQETEQETERSGESSASAPEVSEPDRPAYDFSQPAPEREAVDNSYFKDAAFIGDSRTDGFLIYSGIGCGKNLTSNGLSIFQLEEKKALTIKGEKYTLLEALAMEQYGKVYLSLGINELGYHDDEGFYRSYCEAVDAIREIQPNAVIYIQGLIPVNEEVVTKTGGRAYLKNDHLRVYNDLMRQAALEKQVVFLDLYTDFANEDGELPAEASQDGVHLRRDWCKQWLAYLQTHTVDYDTLYPDGAPQVEEGAEISESGSALS